MGVKTFRPGLGDQLPEWQGLAIDQRRNQQQPSATKTTDRPRRARPAGSTAGDMGRGEVIQPWHRQACLRLTPDAHHPQGRHRHRQPEPFGAARVAHLGLFPMPAAPFGILEARFDPGSQPIPGHIRLLSWQVGQHQPGVGIAAIPARHQRASQLTLGGLEAADRSSPPLPDVADHVTERSEGRAAERAILALPSNPQVGMPAGLVDGLKQPFGIQAAVGSHEHPPVGGHTTVQARKERFPVRSPRARTSRCDDPPGNRDCTAAHQHADGQDGEALS